MKSAGESRLTRRSLLGGASVGLATASAGCLQHARSLVNQDSFEHVSVTIKTVPADDDEAAVGIARRLKRHMDAVGIDASIELLESTELRRDVLFDQSFDVYVGRFPPRHDPDFLRSTLHSQFVTERGWQNPFGVSDLDLDEGLTRQRTTTGSDRREAVADILESVAEIQPFRPLAFPREVAVFRRDRFTNWTANERRTLLDYLTLEPADGADDATLRLVKTDDHITKNLNPLAIEYRKPGTLTGLLYDPLTRYYDGERRNWLAADVTWNDAGMTDTTATVTLRDGVTWHDGEALTATDVAFTYRFLDDTKLDSDEMRVPSPRFRGRTSLVEDLERLDDRTVRVAFGKTAPAVAARALTVPILPKHVWLDKTANANIAGIDVSEGVTQALVWPNTEPVGSGPLQFESRTTAQRLVLSTVPDHFLADLKGGALPYDRLEVRIAPSDSSAVSLVTDGSVDVTGDPVHPSVLENVSGEGAVDSRTTRSRSFYHVGFNARREPFSNVRFRQAVARLLDAGHIAEAIFDGYAEPGATALAGTAWEPATLGWSGSDPVAPFIGTDGDLDVSTAKDVFREAGYAYDDGGRLVQ